MTESLKNILTRRGPIKKIGVIGMGYVGIPSAAVFADSDEYDFVWGFQRDSANSGYKINLLNRGDSPIDGEEPGLNALIKRVVRNNKFTCTSDMTKISEVDAVTIAVDTPIKDTRRLEPDLDSIEESLKITGQNITPGTLVVIESTVRPGLTDEFARNILEKKSGLKAGKDFALAHAPERVMPGRLLKNIQEYDRVIGGIDETSTQRACELYEPILTKGKVIKVNTLTAEISKTAENALRDLQIAAVNELAIYCENMGVNFYDVKKAIDSLEGDITRAVLFPGAGVGGHCLPKDSYHLLGALKQLKQRPVFPNNSDSLFIMARNINDFMPEHMYHLTLKALKKTGKSLKGMKTAILGWAYKKNTDDSRNTPAEKYLSLIREQEAEARIHDPYVTAKKGLPISDDLNDVLEGADIIAVFTDHDDYQHLELQRIKKMTGRSHPILIDGRHVFDPEEALRQGFVYKGIGRGDKNNHRGEE